MRGSMSARLDRELLSPELMRSDSNIGRVFGGRYRAARLIGKGGAASVYEGIDRETAAPVAIKLSHARVTESPALLLHLQHRNTVRTLAWGQSRGGRIFLVVELLAGTTLAAGLHGRRTFG